MEEIDELPIEKAYKNTISSFLSIRGAFCNWLYTEEIHWFYRGCPQGSCFGPFLWRIFINKLLKLLHSHGFTFVAYADDILLMAKGKSRKELENTTNQALELSNWARQNQMTFSYEKCTVLHLRSPRFLKRPPIFKLDNHNLKSENTLQ